MALFKRRRSMLLMFTGGMSAFMFLMLYIGSISVDDDERISVDDDERWQGRHPPKKTTQIPVKPNKDNVIGDVIKHTNISRGAGMEWPKRTPDPIIKIRQKENRAHKQLNRPTAPILQRMQTSVIEHPAPISSEVVPCSALNYECQRFRQLMYTNWPEGKPRAAFYFLTQPSRLHRLKRALRSVDAFFNDQFHYPIIIFHEANLLKHIPAIRNYSTSQMFFQQIEFLAPDFIGEIPKVIPCTSYIGYRHMCRFHAKGVFEQPIMRGLDYYWRLDDDSLLLRNISYDVFQFMRDQQLSYGYQWRHFDSMKCVVGLWNATYKYVAENGIKPQFLSEWREVYIYYNNFEVAEMKLWLSKDYANFIEYLDRLGGIFYHRWGDAPIKGLAVALFIPKQKVHLFKDIGYQHVSFTNP